jgi:Cysteine rich repeat
MIRKMIVAIAALTAIISSSLAQDPQRSGTSQQQQACSKDVSRHCRSVMKESDAIIAGCLRENRAKLSKSCLKAMADSQ